MEFNRKLMWEGHGGGPVGGAYVCHKYRDKHVTGLTNVSLSRHIKSICHLLESVAILQYIVATNHGG